MGRAGRARAEGERQGRLGQGRVGQGGGGEDGSGTVWMIWGRCGGDPRATILGGRWEVGMEG